MTESTENKHVTDGVGKLIEQISISQVYGDSQLLEEASELLADCSKKLEELFDSYIDLEVKSAMRIHELEEELKITKKKLEDYRDLDCLVCK